MADTAAHDEHLAATPEEIKGTIATRDTSRKCGCAGRSAGTGALMFELSEKL